MKIFTMASADLKNILRDSTLTMVLFGPLALFLLLRFGVPRGAELILARWGFDLTAYYLQILGFMSMIPSLLFGLVFGLIILDERDEEMIAYFSITPLQRKGYLIYRLGMPMVASFLFFFVLLYGTNLIDIPLRYAPGLALMACLQAPMGALFLGAFAENKVEGMALGKVFAMIYLAPLAVFFLDSSWVYLSSPIPPFWFGLAIVAAFADQVSYWLFLGIGILVHLGVLAWLIQRFGRQQR